MFSATLTHSLDSLFTQASTGTDVQVTHTTPGGSTITGSPAQPVPASVLATVRHVPGVAAADGQVSAKAVLLGRDGKPLSAPFGVALSWPADSPFQATFSGRTGQPPAGPGQVMIDQASARRGHFAVGDAIGIEIAGHAVSFTITGITGYGSGDSIGGGSMAIFSLGTAQRLFGKAGEFDQIAVKAAPGVSADELKNRIAAVLPAGDEAVTAASAAASAAKQVNGQLGILRDFFLGFAGIAVLVGAFVIWNTFSIMVGQRTRELALTRALGASTGQVFRSVLAEAAIVGAAASVAGAGLGLLLAEGLAALLKSFGLSLPISGLSVPATGLALSIGVGIAATVVASLAPAWRATRVAPVQAMRDAVPESVPFSGRRLVSGLVLTAAGVAAAAGRDLRRRRNRPRRGRSGRLLRRRHRAGTARGQAAGLPVRGAAGPAARPGRRAGPRQHDAQPQAHERHRGRADDRPGRHYRHVSPGQPPPARPSPGRSTRRAEPSSTCRRPPAAPASPRHWPRSSPGSPASWR